MIPVKIDELKKVVALNNLPDEHLQWILDRSHYDEYDDGGLVAKYGDPADEMWMLLEGKVDFYMNVGGRQVHFFTFENNDLAGGVGGMMPYSRMKSIPGYSYAVGKTRVLRMHKDNFHELEQLNPEFVQKLIGYMTERAKSFATIRLKHEKMSALGNLAAGIAHELNNPAAAINGISNELTRRLNCNYELTESLLQNNVTSEHIQKIRTIIKEKETKSGDKQKTSAMQRIQKEDAMEEWLENNGVTDRQAAETFTEFGFSAEDFNGLAGIVGKDAFINLIPWLENLISSRRIILDLSEASNRISELVNSIKSHVQMDRSSDKQPTNIHKDIENTLTLLAFKLREKNIEVKKSFFSDLPAVNAYIGELNQVWTNLIDNAIYALPKNGKLRIDTGFDGKNVYVNVADNGDGIPENVLSRIFEPFFTTKKMGEGTGIGLDIVNRIIKNHNGEIKVYSEPGRTEFTICLPVAESIHSKES